MSEMVNQDKLPSAVRNVFIPFLRQLQDLNGINLVSVFVYGSAAGHDFNPKHSDINSCVVLQQVDLPSLRNNMKIVKQVKSKKITAPLFLTEDHIQTSLDVFPIEFLDMKENHILLFGKDLLSGIDIKGEHIRLFCEQQLKGKLIRIRQAYVEIGLKKGGLEALLKESLSALIPVFRNVIRLKGQTPPTNKQEIIQATADLFSLDPSVMLDIYNDDSNDEKIANRSAESYLDKYIRQIQRLAKSVDAL
jgi:hypothetical protein